jgi:alkylation response protein AidB-like acyl-CoA dehydrogenase
MSPDKLPPLLRWAFPPSSVPDAFVQPLLELQQVLDEEIAPAAAGVDLEARYPTAAANALKRSGILKASVPVAFRGAGAPHCVSLEAQVRIAIADSSVAQVFKIHDELVREIFVYAPDALRQRLAKAIIEDNAIIGLGVAQAGRKVDNPLKTTAAPQPGGGFVIDGRKIYTTGAAEADLIAVWAFNPKAPEIAESPLNGTTLNLVRKGAQGVTIHRDWDGLGQRGTDSGTVTFDKVKTDSLWRGNTPGSSSPPHASLRYQAGFAAVLVGIGVAALRAASEFVVKQSRPWPSGGVDNAADDPYVRRLMGELAADLAAAYSITLAMDELLDAVERGEIERTRVAAPIYAAKSTASRAAVRATSEIYALMGARSVPREWIRPFLA